MRRAFVIAGMALWLLSCGNNHTDSGAGAATGPGTGAAPAGGASSGTNAGTGGANTHADSVQQNLR